MKVFFKKEKWNHTNLSKLNIRQSFPWVSLQTARASQTHQTLLLALPLTVQMESRGLHAALSDGIIAESAWMTRNIIQPCDDVIRRQCPLCPASAMVAAMKGGVLHIWKADVQTGDATQCTLSQQTDRAICRLHTTQCRGKTVQSVRNKNHLKKKKNAKGIQKPPWC